MNEHERWNTYSTLGEPGLNQNLLVLCCDISHGEGE
jgi:hypothetical protein